MNMIFAMSEVVARPPLTNHIFWCPVGVGRGAGKLRISWGAQISARRRVVNDDQKQERTRKGSSLAVWERKGIGVELEAIARIHARGRFSGQAGLRIGYGRFAMRWEIHKIASKIYLIWQAPMERAVPAGLACVLQCAGYCTGLYTSPYLVSFRERIRVNDTLITPEALVRLEERVRLAADTLALPWGEHLESSNL